MQAVKSKELLILGNPKPFSEEQLCRYMYKSLKLWTKWKREINESYLREHIKQIKLVYHPMWVAKLLLLADRKPFPPKKIPRMCFVDAVSGYRGLLSAVHPTTTIDVGFNEGIVIKSKITEQSVKKYIKDVQERQINRQYVLKKPEHRIVDYFLVHLPLWKIKVESDLLKKEFIINGNPGESEEFLASQWTTSKWTLNE